MIFLFYLVLDIFFLCGILYLNWIQKGDVDLKQKVVHIRITKEMDIVFQQMAEEKLVSKSSIMFLILKDYLESQNEKSKHQSVKSVAY